MTEEFEKLSYPIGKFKYSFQISDNEYQTAIKEIANLPQQLISQCQNLSLDQLNQKYRPNSWDINQLVHHLADSHMNAYIRMKLGKTKSGITIIPYPEELWAELQDVKALPIKVSINLLEALHLRLTVFLSSLTSEEMQLGYVHPDNNKFISIKQAALLYAWHGKHHLAHIQLALNNPY